MHGKHRGNTLFSSQPPLTISLQKQVPKMESKENGKLETSILLSTILPTLFSELINILQNCTSAALPRPLIKENKIYPRTGFILQQPKP